MRDEFRAEASPHEETLVLPIVAETAGIGILPILARTRPGMSPILTFATVSEQASDLPHSPPEGATVKKSSYERELAFVMRPVCCTRL